jgi:hypothetical protein
LACLSTVFEGGGGFYHVLSAVVTCEVRALDATVHPTV